MYDKLGEMLNEALESGKIPQNEHKPDPEEPVVECEQSEHIETNSDSGFIFKKKKQIPTGEVIKLHKYTYNMQYPPYIQKALTTLDVAYPSVEKDISKQYHKLLKQYHPDTQNTIQHSQDVQNIRQKTIDEITEAYKILCDFFGIK